jgi:hypothetical protein
MNGRDRKASQTQTYARKLKITEITMLAEYLYLGICEILGAPF